jgi:DNA-binding CsgD family transcriptional regulator
MSGSDNPPVNPPGPSRNIPTHAVAGDVIWETLAAEPETGVSVLRADGLILYANELCATALADLPSEAVIGRKLADLFPEAWVRERLELFARMGPHNEFAMIRSIWRGRQIRSTIRWIATPGKELDQFLLLTRIGPGKFPADPTNRGAEIVESKLVELGRLDVLTTRELEVLALLGQGLRLKEIAAILHRAPKTIENHRLSIGRKLGETDRVKLASIASEAGLKMPDATLVRIKPHKR